MRAVILGGTDTDLLVDLLAYRAADVRALLPVLADVGSPVLVSSRAVYVDPAGRHVNSGYVSARAHWQTMFTRGFAHPADRCPPLGSFVFWDTGRPFGHVSLVVQADPVGCDPAKIDVTANEVFDAATGNHGGVYLLPFARLDHMYLGGHGYLGWSPPVCAGVLLPAGTLHAVPAGG